MRRWEPAHGAFGHPAADDVAHQHVASAIAVRSSSYGAVSRDTARNEHAGRGPVKSNGPKQPILPLFSRSLIPPRAIDAFPHGMVSAHEVETMAAIARADVDGLSVRRQRCGIGLMSGKASREQRRRGRGGDRLLRRRR
jgi:hypothetical protein